MPKSAFSRSNGSIPFWMRQSDYTNERRLKKGACHIDERLKRAAEMSSEEIVESLEDLWQQQRHPESN